jgi:hypothetical protein
MAAKTNKSPQDKFKTEIKAVFFRYSDESDLDDAEMVKYSYEAIEEMYGDVMELDSEEDDELNFEPDFDLESDE